MEAPAFARRTITSREADAGPIVAMIFVRMFSPLKDNKPTRWGFHPRTRTSLCLNDGCILAKKTFSVEQRDFEAVL